MNATCRRLLLALLAVAVAPVSSRAGAAESDLAWPPVTRETRPWSYWWWLGSAVDSTNLTRELQRYRAVGWGGVHIIPIYGAKGWEDRYIECQRVKRAAPGGAGHMLNLFYAPGMQNYLRRFDEAFDSYDGSFPRSMCHDSYEYNSNWSPDLLAQFARRRGYRLQSELPALLDKTGDDRAARVRCDYRETLSDLLIEETLPLWVNWAHDRGMRTRNQAHRGRHRSCRRCGSGGSVS